MLSAKSIGIASSVAAVAVASILLVATKISHSKSKNEKDGDSSMNSTRKRVQLTQNEEAMLGLGLLPPTCTLTWFKGEGRDIHKVAFEQIRNRMRDIVRNNPWLLGKFVKVNGHVHIEYYDDSNSENKSAKFNSNLEDNMSEMLCEVPVEQSKIFYGMPYMELTRTILDHYSLKKKKDFEQPFWQVFIVPCSTSKSPGTRFAIVTSMSHYVGDGHSFYSLQNMLLGSSDQQQHDGKTTANTSDNHCIRPLSIQRILETGKMQEALLGKKEATMSTSIGLIVGIMRAMLLNALGLKKSQPSCRIFLIDRAKIDSIKQQHTGNNRRSSSSTDNFVSTNDIITSWFLSHPKYRHGGMVLNCRKRIQGHHDDLVGNYQNTITFRCPEDTSTPTDIRRSLKLMKRAVTTDMELSDWDMAFGNMGLTTNWASFAGSANLHRCQELVHLPIMDPLGAPPILEACTIFRARPGTFGAILTGDVARIEDRAPFESDEKLYQ